MNSTIKPKPCSNCGSPYHSAMYHKPRKAIAVHTLPKRSKRPKQIGKGTLKYNEWRDQVARPYGNTELGCRPYRKQGFTPGAEDDSK